MADDITPKAPPVVETPKVPGAKGPGLTLIKGEKNGVGIWGVVGISLAVAVVVVIGLLLIGAYLDRPNKPRGV